MRKLLVILFLAFLFTYSYADGEKKRTPWLFSLPGDYVYSTYPPNLFDPDYLEKHNRFWLFQQGFSNSLYNLNWMNNYYHGVICVRKPPSLLSSFFYGLGRGISRSRDYYYRDREQRRYNKSLMGLLELKWASEGKSKLNSHENYRGWKFYPRGSYNHQKAKEIYEAGKEANLRRIKELDRIIEQRKKQEKQK